MSSRASLYPAGAAQTTSSSAATKQRQIAQLASRLAEMSRRVEAFDRQVDVACLQAQQIRELACMQAALFMASSRTLGPDSATEDQQS